MPAIRGIYYAHPVTGEPGLWVQLLNGNVLGRSDAQIAALRPGGNPGTKSARFRTALIGLLQPLLERRTPLSNWSAEDQAYLIANPEPYCRIEGSDYVAQESVIDIEILSLDPVRIQITVSEGASHGQWAYG